MSDYSLGARWMVGDNKSIETRTVAKKTFGRPNVTYINPAMLTENTLKALLMTLKS